MLWPELENPGSGAYGAGKPLPPSLETWATSFASSDTCFSHLRGVTCIRRTRPFGDGAMQIWGCGTQDS